MSVVGVAKILTSSQDRSVVPSSFAGLRPGGSFQDKQRRGNLSPVVWTAAKSRNSVSCTASLEDVWAQVVSKTDISQLAFVLVFSAFPFVAVKAIANSGVGSQLNDDLEKKRPALQAEVTVQEVARERAQLESPWYGEQRPRWLGPIPYQYPTYLDGTAAGDYGFDLFGLAKEKKDFDRYLNLEVLHGRWAMLGALGALVPELLSRYSDTPFLETLWWNVGYAKLLGDDLDYLGIPGLHIAGGQGIAIIAIAQFLLMLGPEYARATGIRALEPLGIFLPGDINYPGSWLFDPLGLSKNARLFEDLKVREMKNGRLAMVAWVGFAAQAAVTNQGLLDNWFDFLADPEHANVFARYFGDLSQYPTYVALKASVINASGALQAQPAYQEVAASAASLWGDLQSSPLFQVLLAGVGSALFALSGGMTGAPAGM